MKVNNNDIRNENKKLLGKVETDPSTKEEYIELKNIGYLRIGVKYLKAQLDKRDKAKKMHS